MKKRALYLLVISIFLTGQALILVAGYHHSEYTMTCPFRLWSGWPCPLCGSTTAIFSLYAGKWSEALFFNPLGIMMYLVSIISLLIISFDLFTGKDLFYRIFRKADQKVFVRENRFFLTALVLLNWIWSILRECH
ncbi:MAG: DUF2752 domain-containing protein [Saprospiraceae bacterium]|nr:DUF2752 domain-containing protein [Saprospiraceae bacterium]